MIGSAPYTAMIVNRQGEIVDFVTRQNPPDVEFVAQLNNRFRGLAFHLFDQGEYQVSDVRNVINDILEGYALLDAGKLRPGANCS